MGEMVTTLADGAVGSQVEMTVRLGKLSLVATGGRSYLRRMIQIFL